MQTEEGSENTNSNTMPLVVTHSGNFHTDEVFAVAALRMALGVPCKVVRTRDEEVIARADYVVDVGKVYEPESGRFDHHQEGGAGVRENGVPYSSFGLVWKHFGARLCGSDAAAERVERQLVMPVDAGDNGMNIFNVCVDGVAPYLLHNVTAAFRPTWREARGSDDGYFEMLSLAELILRREIRHAVDAVEGERFVLDAYRVASDKRIIVLEDHYPWEEVLSKFPEPLYVVKPDRQNGGAWKVRAVRDNPCGFENRKDLPETWAGKCGDELAAITGVGGALFCHNKRFIAVASSKDAALALAKQAVEY